MTALLLLAATGLAHASGIEVKSNPPGGEVWIDGQPTGQQTPALVDGLDPGTHEVTVFRRCLGARADVEVLGSGAPTLELELTEAAGNLLVVAQPEDAEIELGERGMMLYAGVPTAVQCGTHSLKITSPGHATAVLNVDVHPLVTTTVPVSLDAVGIAVLSVDVAPENARIWLNDRLLGAGGQRVEVTAGPHALRAELEGFLTQERQVLAYADETTPIAFSLRPLGTELTMADAAAPKTAEARKRRPWIGLTMAGLGAASMGYGYWEYTQAKPYNDEFLSRKSKIEGGEWPDAYDGAPADWAYEVYDEQIGPRQGRMIIAETVGGLLLGTGLVLTFAI